MNVTRKEWASLEHLISKLFAENVVISESLFCYLIIFYGNQGNLAKVEFFFKKGFEFYKKASLRVRNFTEISIKIDSNLKIVTSLMASYGKLGLTEKLHETYETYKFLNYDDVAYTAVLNSIMTTVRIIFLEFSQNFTNIFLQVRYKFIRISS